MIIRARHNKDDPYFRLRRATAQDAHLSWAARGVITYLFSKPDNWEVRVDDLVGQGNLGRDAIYKILMELQQSSYIHRHKERRPDGTIGRWVIDVYETPHPDFQELADLLPDLFAAGSTSRRALFCRGGLLGFPLIRFWLRFRVHQESILTIHLDSARQQQEKSLAHGSLGLFGDLHHLSLQFGRYAESHK